MVEINYSIMFFTKLFIIIGIIIIGKTLFEQYDRFYYEGESLSHYTDSLKEKPIYHQPRRRHDYYTLLFTHKKNDFIVSDNSFLIVSKTNSRLSVMNNMKPNDIVTVLFVPENSEQQNTIKIIGLFSKGETIISPDEVYTLDKKQKRSLYIFGSILICIGSIFYFIERRIK